MAIVSCTKETRPKRSEEEWARIKAMKEKDIDFSDIPEITSMEGLTLRPRQNIETKHIISARKAEKHELEVLWQ